MVPRLVKDALWRNRWAYFIYGPIQLPFWFLFDGRSSALPISFVAFSMIAAAMLGPMFAAASMGLRELRHLPVTARDVWRTTWFVATVVPTAILLTTKTIALLLVTMFAGRSAMSVEGILISMAFDFMWAGTVLLMFPLLGYAGQVGAERGAVASSLAGAASIAGMLVGFGAPLLASDALPVRMSEFTFGTATLLIVGVAIAFGATGLTPTRGPLAGERTVQGRRGSVRPGAATPLRFADRLTGISRVAVPHLSGTLALAVFPLLGLAAYGLITGSGPWWFLPQTPSVFDPDDVGDRGLTYFVMLPCMVGVALAIWTPWARLLKVLPLSVKQINALLLATPFATWTILWVIAWGAYALAYGTPQILRLGFAFGMAAISALVQAALFRFQGSSKTVFVLGALGGLMPQVVKVGLRDDVASQIVFAVISVSALCAAVFINHRTLTRSTSLSRAYRPPVPPFGISPTARIR